jgi:diacylglycerol kinase family enzyme
VRRASAIVACAAAIALLLTTLWTLTERLLLPVVASACLMVGIAAASYALTRAGARRVAAASAAIAAVVALVVLVVANDSLLTVVLVVALLAIVGSSTRYALGRDMAALKASPTPGSAVRAAVRPVLFLNPRSGDGKVARYGLVEEAGLRGIEAVVLKQGDDLVQLAADAVARGADAIGVAGGDGSQALVADVARQHGVAFVCVPAGTRNHLAMDLGLDRDDVVGALDAFGEAMERRIDLALLGERVFVNNVTMGLYAKIVQSPEYRDHKVETVLDMLPAMLGPGGAPFDLRFTGPDGTVHRSAHVILVSNGRYELTGPQAFGSRRRIDGGALGIVTAEFRSSGDVARFIQLQAVGQAGRFRGWINWTDTRFEVRSGAPVEVGLDGEALTLDPPLEFRILPGALRVRIPRGAPGLSPAAAAARPGWSTITAVLQTAAGRPVAIER